MKHDIRTDSWFLFPLSIPPMQRYAMLMGIWVLLALLWWSWIYNPLRRHRAGLSSQLQLSSQQDSAIGDKLIALSQSLNHELSCKELSSIASLSRVTFNEIRFETNHRAHLSFYGTYTSLLLCLQSLYERCPDMRISKMHMTVRDQNIRYIALDVSHLKTV